MEDDFKTQYRTMKLEPDQISRLQRVFDHPTSPVSNDRRFFWRACEMLKELLETHTHKELFQYAEVGGVRHQYGVYKVNAEWVDEFAKTAPVSKGRVWYNVVRLYLPVIEQEIGLSDNGSRNA